MAGPLIALNESSQRVCLILQILFTIFTSAFVGLRIFARRSKDVKLQWDDYLIVGALVFFLGLIACDMTATLYCGIGLHATDVVTQYGPERLITFLKLLIPIQILWAFSLTATKFSILLFYCRIFAVPYVQRIAKVLVVVIVLWCASALLCAFFLCRPFAFSWDHTITNGVCGDRILSYLMTGVVSILIDITVLALPLPVIWNLQMPRANKIGTIAIFAAGFLVCIVSIVRLKVLVTVDYTDATHSVTLGLIWTMLEPSIGIILSCVPIMRSLIPAAFRSISGSKKSGEQTHYHRSRLSRSQDFDEHPLQPMAKKRRRVYGDLESTGTGDGDNGSLGEIQKEVHRGGPLANATQQITVKQDYDVR